MKRVKLVSGGVDSYIMSQLYKGINVYVDFGQKYSDVERKALDKLGVKYDVIKIDSKFKTDTIYIDDRNLMLSALMCLVYSPDEIMIAGLKDDNCKDKTEVEFELMSQMLTRYASKPVKLVSPFWDKTKGDIVAEFNDKEALKDTFSCYEPRDGLACGDCPACLRKVVALETNGIDSGIKLSDRVIKEYLGKIHLYDVDRISRFFIYLKKKSRVLAVDIDGVLCEEDGGYDYAKKRMIKKVDLNEFGGYKILYTARLEKDREVTEKWLKKHKIKYDALIMNKLPYDWIIDDRAISLEREV